uniref:Uncharacterized protein n=1 Tax=Rhizophora mucronata TaxID=61149 RepID=A0A2P2NXI7_RHIMU
MIKCGLLRIDDLYIKVSPSVICFWTMMATFSSLLDINTSLLLASRWMVRGER